jgi:flavin reductase
MNDDFLAAMSRAANTVCVVTTDGMAGRFGVTVSAMTSVSAEDPDPSLLVCVHHLSPACEAIQRNRVFCANVLGSDQAYISDCFAGRTRAKGLDKFDCADWATGETGAPVLLGAQATFDCSLLHDFRVGSHRIFVGQVSKVTAEKNGLPLIYHGRSYAEPIAIRHFR